ncbi:hypothetical protein PIB30_050925 [Stylosanthes scabra]|uniref:Aminotransferase-like plant mobile domain-containing protein n=1 Tax=Stylosanthes scabra TaxID=79078 RepID=A0ABU6QII5_9FABA|nr:hypothetical protein [Stylosanthes scabra]
MTQLTLEEIALPTKTLCIGSIGLLTSHTMSTERQRVMELHPRISPYVLRAGLLPLTRLNDYWFKVDEPLINAFLERWRPETHSFHKP